VGVVIGGVARRGLAAQARVKDSHGRSHYLMVEPDMDDEVFGRGHAGLDRQQGGRLLSLHCQPPSHLM
jgi:hypothetical protein